MLQVLYAPVREVQQEIFEIWIDTAAPRGHKHELRMKLL